jgi:hypothetical protein
MKKLELKLEDLRVDTFEIGSRLAERGTVLGREAVLGTVLCTANTCLVCVQVQVATLVYSCECKSADCDSNETCVSCALIC